MAKEKKVEYERVDRKFSKYKRILVKFNPSFGDADFEIEFVPLEHAYEAGQKFVRNIDSMSMIDLYPWDVRKDALRFGLVGPVRFMDKGKPEPRQIISRVKQVSEGIKEVFSEPTSFVYNHFLRCGQLGSLPFTNEDFNIEKLRVAIEESDYPGFTAEGEEVERPLVEHLFDTRKTEYIQANILRFLEIQRLVIKSIVEEYDEKQRQ